LQAKASAKTNSVPVDVTEMAFEGNFVNIFVRDAKGATHMVQSQNDPNNPPPARGSKQHMVFDTEDAVVLVDAATGSH
jgi:spermidine/putrescine transport system ATP-binding protein